MAAKKTHLYEFHREHGKVTEFAGFEMPLWFKGISEEHLAVRGGVGVFDVSHMGRSLIRGSEAEELLNYVTTNNVSSLAPMSAHYSVFCNEEGGIKDDFVLSRLGEEEFLIVYNASNREKDYEWMKSHSETFKAEVEDVSDEIAMFAVQGPYAERTLQKLSTADLSEIGRFKCGWTEIRGVKTFLSRTGYTGEDGFEVFVWDSPLDDPGRAFKVWNGILEAGEEYGIEPCGLGSRDTLRLEAGMCLYGNDITEETTPLEARLSFVVKFDKGDFIGKEALMKQKAEGIDKRRVGMRMLERGIPRSGYEVRTDDGRVRRLTSGTYSPLLQLGIAMAYLPPEHSGAGTEVEVNIRGKPVKGAVVKLPFYRRLTEETVYLMGEKIPCPVGDWDKLRGSLI